MSQAPEGQIPYLNSRLEYMVIELDENITPSKLFLLKPASVFDSEHNSIEKIDLPLDTVNSAEVSTPGYFLTVEWRGKEYEVFVPKWATLYLLVGDDYQRVYGKKLIDLKLPVRSPFGALVKSVREGEGSVFRSIYRYPHGRVDVYPDYILALHKGLLFAFEDVNTFISRHFIDKLTAKVTEKLPDVIEMETDKILRRLILSKKKRYVAEKDDYSLVIKGVELRRGDAPEIAKKLLRKTIDILTYYIPPVARAKIIDLIERTINNLRDYNFDINDVIVSSLLNKELDEYEGDSLEYVLGQRLREKGIPVNVGFNLRYVVLKGSGRISDRALPVELFSDYVREKYGEMSYDEAVERIKKDLDINYIIERATNPVINFLEFMGVSKVIVENIASSQKTLMQFLGTGRRRVKGYNPDAF